MKSHLLVHMYIFWLRKQHAFSRTGLVREPVHYKDFRKYCGVRPNKLIAHDCSASTDRNSICIKISN